MTPTPNNNTPEIFTRLKAEGLDVTEHAEIKAVLLARARASSTRTSTAVPSPYLTWIRQSSMAFASFALLFVGTAGAAQYSAPGDLLYSVKVNVNEELVSLTTFDPEAKIAYDVLLLERRYDEIKALAAATSPDEAAIATVMTEVEERTEDVTDALAVADTDTVTYEERFETLVTVASLAEAHQVVASRISPAYRYSLAASEAVIYESLNEAAVAAVAASSTATALTVHMSETLSEIETEVKATSTADTVEAAVLQHLTELETSLTEGDLTEAVVSLSEAKQTLLTEDYLEETVPEDTEATEETRSE